MPKVKMRFKTDGSSAVLTVEGEPDANKCRQTATTFAELNGKVDESSRHDTPELYASAPVETDTDVDTNI